MRIKLIALGFLALTNQAMAEGDFFPPVTDATTKEECSGCHIAYPAGLLPVRSWEKIMGSLDDHFGENATIPADKVTVITTCLTKNAADAKGKRSKVMRDITADDTPLRISDTAWFKHEHGTFSQATLARIKSTANCSACHKQAAEGYFEDD